MGWRIVPFEPRHAAAFKALNEAWISRWFALEPADQKALGDPEGYIIARGGTIFMAEDVAGQAVGTVALIPLDDGGFEVGKMTVAEAARGTGLGRGLMNACIAHGRAAGAPRLYLETNSALTPALTLYRASGFVDLPPRPTPYARADVFMEKRL